MMRMWCFVAFMLAGMACAQSASPAFLHQLVRIAATENKPLLQNDTQGLAQLPPLRFDCESHDVQHFHVTDLNGDNLSDLLYNGPCKPYPQTAAFIHIGIGYQKAFDVAGAVMKIEPSVEGATVYTYNPAIGCIMTHRIGSYRLDRRGKLVAFSTLHWLPGDTLSPSSAFVRVPLRGVVREHPTVRDVPYEEPCFGDTVIGNRLFEIPDIAMGWLLRTQGDWQQVLVAHGDSNYRVAWIHNQFQDMHPNAILLQRFYEGFQQKNHRQMAACYHDSATFRDPVFDLKNGKEARAMWHYLCENGKDLVITFRDIQADDRRGRAHWEADYTFSATGRRVHNVIDAEFEFRDGKIIMHRDRFKFYKWTRMALGATGTMLGWTPLVKGKVRKMAMKGLRKFMADKPEYQ